MTGHIDISKLRKNGWNEEILSQFCKESKMHGLSKERVDPFSALDEGKEEDDYEAPMIHPYGK